MDVTVLDFWQWVASDIRMHTTRSMLAKYCVAVAVGSKDKKRIEWDDYDVVSPDGIKIELKASGYRQNWGQNRKSVPKFGGFLA